SISVARIRRMAARLPARADQAAALRESVLSLDVAAGEESAALHLLLCRRPAAGDIPPVAFLRAVDARRMARAQRLGGVRAHVGASLQPCGPEGVAALQRTCHDHRAACLG